MHINTHTRAQQLTWVLTEPGSERSLRTGIVNDGWAGAHKHLHTLVGTRQQSLISGEGERSCLTVVHFVLLRCHYLTAGIEEVTRLGAWRRGGGGGADLSLFAPAVSFIGSLRDGLHPPDTQTHTFTHTHKLLYLYSLSNCISTHIPPLTHTLLSAGLLFLKWTLTCYTNICRGSR